MRAHSLLQDAFAKGASKPQALAQDGNENLVKCGARMDDVKDGLAPVKLQYF